MDSYLTSLESAKKTAKVADHMLTVTHNVVNDPKLLLLVVEKLALTQQHLIRAVLSYEVHLDRIPAFRDDIDSMIALFKMRCSRRYNLDNEHVDVINHVQEILKHHKASPVEFSRKDKYVICSEEYNTDVISKKQLKQYVEKTKALVKAIEEMITK